MKCKICEKESNIGIIISTSFICNFCVDEVIGACGYKGEER